MFEYWGIREVLRYSISNGTSWDYFTIFQKCQVILKTVDESSEQSLHGHLCQTHFDKRLRDLPVFCFRFFWYHKITKLYCFHYIPCYLSIIIIGDLSKFRLFIARHVGEIFSFQFSTPMSATTPHDSRNRNRNRCITITEKPHYVYGVNQRNFKVISLIPRLVLVVFRRVFAYPAQIPTMFLSNRRIPSHCWRKSSSKQRLSLLLYYKYGA